MTTAEAVRIEEREARTRQRAIHPGMTREELRALGAGCTAPHWICPRLDSVRRRIGQ